MDQILSDFCNETVLQTFVRSISGYMIRPSRHYMPFWRHHRLNIVLLSDEMIQLCLIAHKGKTTYPIVASKMLFWYDL